MRANTEPKACHASDSCCATGRHIEPSLSSTENQTDDGSPSTEKGDVGSVRPRHCCKDNQAMFAPDDNFCVSEPSDQTSGSCNVKNRHPCCHQSPRNSIGTLKNNDCPKPRGIDAPMRGKSDRRGAKDGQQTSAELNRRESLSSYLSISSKEPLVTTEACSEHLKRAYEEYTSHLEKGLCICRRVIDRLDSCCGNATPIPTSNPIHPDHSGGCAPTPLMSRQDDRTPVRQKKKTVTVNKRTTANDCDAQKDTRLSSSASNQTANRFWLHRGSGTRDSLHNKINNKKTEQEIPAGTVEHMDVEDVAARQHVLLSVSGMTCTGCSKKMTNVLTRMPFLSCVKVTFVSGLVEFDLDAKAVSLQDLLPRVERETGFKCSRVVGDYQTIDLILDPTTAHRLGDDPPMGVDAVEKVRRNTYRISYNPLLIGARSLVSDLDGACLAPPGHDNALEDGRRRLRRMAIWFALAAVLTLPIVVLEWSHVSVPHNTRSIISLVLATIVQGIAIPEFYATAIKSLVYSRILEMDMLVVISITAAYGYSLVAFALIHAGFTLEEEEFFETSALLITLVLLGRVLAAWARVRAVSAVSLRSLQAQKTLLVSESEGTTEIDARLLQFGDVVVVAPHSRAVTDGKVVDGASSVDESMITGESIPVSKTVGDVVVAGTINGPSPLTVQLTRLPGKNSITDIAEMVENALGAKPDVQDLADKVAGWFIPAVMAISLLVLVIWLVVAIKVRGESIGGAIGVAITYSIAVLAVSCPCALGLAVPMVLVIAGGVAARMGLIIKQADAIERAYQVTDVVFDKTGTITTGDLSVVQEQILPHPIASEDDIWALIKSATQNNGHPVSRTVFAAVEKKKKKPPSLDVALEHSESVPGSGIQSVWRGMILKVGNPFWLGIEDHEDVAVLLNQGMTLLCVTLDSIPVAMIGLKSAIRPEAGSVVADLHARKIRCHIVSGDGPQAVADVAQTVDIPGHRTASRHSPSQKQEYVKRLMDNDGRGSVVVLFCGDGTNDAVAVAQANVGVQIAGASGIPSSSQPSRFRPPSSPSPATSSPPSSTTLLPSSSPSLCGEPSSSPSDVTRATADVVLLGGLEGIPALLTLSRRAFHRITFNFVWAAVYNVVAILLAAGAFVRVRIPPAYAGLGEIVSVGPVILAAVTLLRGMKKKRKQ